jgi:spermidine synthase
MHPEEPILDYLQAMLFMAKKSPGNTCLLGLGGGAIAHSLSPYLGDYSITAVENNPEVIEIASEFFMIKRIKQLKIVAEDGNSFIENYIQNDEAHAFKHILVDLFNNESFPEQCFNETFFENCKKCLQKDGVIAVNVANKTEHRPIFKLLQQQFNSAIVSIPIKNSSNIVFLASNAGSVTPLLDCFKNSKEVKRLTWDNHWGTVAVLKPL